MTNDVKHRFNDDLLDADRDIELAGKLYPAILHVLDDPDLRTLFRSYDDPANAAKRRSRRAGLLAVGLGALALLLAAAHQLAELDHGHKVISKSSWLALDQIAALAGLASFAIGFGGVMFADAKRQWLARRLMTERIRQFHFQTFVWRLSEIGRSLAGTDAAARYVAVRRAWLAAFSARFEGKLGAELNLVVAAEEPTDHAVHPLTTRAEVDMPQSEGMSQLFAAYRELRLTHQLQYAAYKLGQSSDHSLSTPRSQAWLFSTVSLFSIAMLFVLHFGALIATLAGYATLGSSPWMHFATLALAVSALAIRALEEGLKPEREIERYAHYKSAVRALRDRFDAARSSGQKIEVMNEMERLVYDEMCDFLKTQDTARFVL